MDDKKKKRLEDAGFTHTDIQKLLGLTGEDVKEVEKRVKKARRKSEGKG